MEEGGRDESGWSSQEAEAVLVKWMGGVNIELELLSHSNGRWDAGSRWTTKATPVRTWRGQSEKELICEMLKDELEDEECRPYREGSGQVSAIAFEKAIDRRDLES